MTATRVLLIEDDAAWASLTREAFIEAAPGTRLEILTDGDEALARLEDGDHPDLVLLDLNMPGTDGREVMRAIRSLPNVADLEIVVLSASVSASDRALAVDLGAAYANKPTTFAALCHLAKAVVTGALDDLDSEHRPSRPRPVDQPAVAVPATQSAANVRVVLVSGGDSDVVVRLADAGLEVSVVATVDDLISADLSAVDCVIVELDGPGIRRHEALRSAVAACPPIPVVAIIGSSTEAAELVSLASGAADVVPVEEATREVLRRTVRFAVERAALGRALEEQRRFFDSVLDNIDAGIMACDVEGRMRIRNRAANFFEASSTDARGAGPFAALARDMVDLRSGEAVAGDGALRRALGGETVPEMEFAVPDDSGELRICVVRGEPLSSSGGEKLGAVVVCYDVTEQRQAETALTHQALHDPLTGLPNRTLALDRVHHALERGARDFSLTAVLFLDLDGFKKVNDTIGHAAGDVVLQTVADRIHAALRTGDTVARFGGDEFLVISESVPDPAAAELLADRIHTSLGKPLPIAGAVIEPSASIGIVVASRSKGVDQVLQDADSAMYEAKHQGGGRSQVFTPDLRDVTHRRSSLAQSQRDAIRHDRLQMAYQPLVDLRTGALHGLEAVAKWAHPELGEVSPAEFVEAAEGSPDLARRLGEWSVQEACRALAGRGDLQLYVNLSAPHLLVPDMADTLLHLVGETGMAPQRLSLGLTGTPVVEATRAARRMLERFKDAGVSLAIDDFGTGHAWLRDLRDLPVDVLKIDRSFIAGMSTNVEDDAVVAALIGLAQGLGMDTIASGVTTIAQRDRLRLLGCTFGQGGLFAEPGALDEVLRTGTSSYSY
ncbi:MAG: hypothetical protein JWN29_1802 [Acidimicrobiales bacterium]|nr:hypothetical protein [Acidimicrobiales bacterium]